MWILVKVRVSQVAQVVKNLPAKAGTAGDTGSIRELGRSPGGGNGNPLQYSCLENSMDRRAWWATVHGVERDWAHRGLMKEVAFELGFETWADFCRQKWRMHGGRITRTKGSKRLYARKAESNGVLKNEGLQVPWLLELIKMSSRWDRKHKLQPCCTRQ